VKIEPKIHKQLYSPVPINTHKQIWQTANCAIYEEL